VKINVTYFVEVTSSWCYWAEPAWAELKECYAGQPVDFDWKLALLGPSGIPASREQAEWFYRRSGTMVRSPFMLNSGWFEPGLKEYLAPNLVAEAAKDFGVTDDRVRLAIADAALYEGKRVGQWKISAGIAAKAAKLNAKKLLARAQSSAIEKRARAATAEFHALKATQRPAFFIQSNIGDRAVFSGIAKAAPLIATIDVMLNDAAGYATHAAHFGPPPTS
jgi:predicted DsbA family dithiol-disulfide isomerase